MYLSYAAIFMPEFQKHFNIKLFCREEGIRTLDTLLAYTRFPSVRLRPLDHLSKYFHFLIAVEITKKTLKGEI